MNDLAESFHQLPPDKQKALALLLKRRGIDAYASLPISRVGRAGPLPLSFGQQRLWFLARLDPDSAAYHIADALRLHGTLDMAALQAALDGLVERHESLRTVFVEDQGKPAQTILPQRLIPIQTVDLSGLGEAAEPAARAWVESAATQPFDLGQGPLLRVGLLTLAADAQVLTLVMHHIIADEWSLNLLLAELGERYATHCQGRSFQRDELPIQYADYAVWQRNWLESGEMARQLDYWKAQLGEEHTPLELPSDHPRPLLPCDHGEKLEFRLPADWAAPLQALCRSAGVTPFMLLLAVFKVLLYRHSGQGDVRVGVPIANRSRAETQQLIGFFVNTVVLRTQLDGREQFMALLGQVKASVLESQSHAELPFEQLVEALGPERSASHNPLFQVMFNHQRLEPAAASLGGLELAPFPRDSHTTQFDLSLDTVEHTDGSFSGLLTYGTALFERGTVERLAQHFQNLLRAVLSNPRLPVGELELLSPPERQQLLALNAQTAEYPYILAVHQMISQIALARPESKALRFGHESWSYAELEQRSNWLAQRLASLGVKTERVVAVALPRSAEMVTAALAVFKVGGVYLPLDIDTPTERLHQQMDDAGVAVVLTNSAVALRLPMLGQMDCLLLDQNDEAEDGPAPVVEIHPGQLAYLTYTSGSTGTPKAVAVSHAALAMHCRAMLDAYRLEVGEHVLHFASASFDAALEQWAVPLLAGACVVISGADLWSVERTRQAIRDFGISRVDLPPAYAVELAASLSRAEGNDLNHPHPSPPPLGEGALELKSTAFLAETNQLQSCTVGGEALPQAGLAVILDRLRPQRLVNAYGPTETVITALLWETTMPCASAYAPIGRPVGERSSWVLDAALNLLPIGVTGELYIGGTGVARGYLGHPAMTAERFIPDPFGPPGARLYRTGDRVRQGADGIFEFLGRCDSQLKIRGFRIEPGEIESALLAHPAVAEAVVLAAGTRLLAYVAGKAQSQELAAHLQSRLPAYMLPTQIVVLEQLPHNQVGKIDRKALPMPDAPSLSHLPPRNATEQQLADIWREVLGVERVGIADNFFELGGDSIVSLQVVSRARQAGLTIEPRDVFRHQTITSLAAVARCLEVDTETAQQAVTGPVPLTPIQREFFDTDIPKRQHWNQSVLLESATPLQVHALEQALRQLVAHHDALRLRFRHTDDWQQWHEDSTGLLLRHVSSPVDAAALADIAEQTQRSLDLAAGPLLRAVVMDMTDGTGRLLLVVHHLVVDGVSWRILLEDLQTLYKQRVQGKEPRLPDKTCAFKVWAEYLQTQVESAQAERAFWISQCEGTLDLPRDEAVATGRHSEAETFSLSLTEDDTRRLLQEAPAAYRTRIDELLLTALARAVCRWSRQADVQVELESHGRAGEAAGLDLSRSVGWFTSAYPVRLRPAATLAQSIPSIKETLRGIPRSGLGFGLLKYLAGTDTRAAFHALPKPRISFNYLGQFDSSFVEAEGFRPAHESRGEERDGNAPLGNWLDINGQVYGGRLELSWIYSRTMYRRETVATLAQSFQAEILAVIEECVNGVGGLTPSDFPLARLAQPQLDSLPLPTRNIEDIYPLTPMQQGMLFHSLHETEGGSYVTGFDMAVEGLNPERFKAAWREAMTRHTVLRTGFFWQGEAALQIVQRTLELPLTELDWRGMDDAVAPRLAALAAAEQQRGFNLAEPPLFRLVLVRLDETLHHLIWVSHHLLLDGWSSARLLGDVLRAYLGQPLATSGAYRDYIAWLQGRDAAADERYWRQRLQDLEAPTRLAESLSVANPGKGHGLLHGSLDAATSQRLAACAKEHKITLNTLLQAAWALLLRGHTGAGTVAFGVTVAGRPADLPGAKDWVGLFINTLPMLQSPKPSMRLADWLQAVQQDNMALREHEHTPLYDIQRWWGGGSLFDTLLVFENYPIDRVLQEHGSAGLRFGPSRHEETTHYPLTLAVQFGEVLSIAYDYDLAHFDDGGIAQLRQQFEHLLRQMAEAGNCHIGAVDWLDAEGQRQLAEWNHYTKEWPDSEPAHALIRRQAQVQPEALALACGEERLSFGELDLRAGLLARHLRGLGLGRENVVGLALSRSPQMIIAMLGVWQAGAAFLPLDPTLPPTRLTSLLEEAGATLLLAEPEVLAQVPTTLPCLPLEAGFWAGEAQDTPAVPIHPEQLAYLIHTSGSSGIPKAVAVSHGALSKHLLAAGALYVMDSHDVALHFAAFSFDAALEQWAAPLAHGAAVVLGEPRWTGEEVAEVVEREGVTVIYPPTPHLLHLAETLETQGRRLPLRVCTVGGEAVARNSLVKLARVLRPNLLINGYGPTETVVTPLAWVAPQDVPCPSAYAPIGHALGERSTYVLDDALNPLPVGVAGELYIGGPCLARGYAGQPGLSAECFIPDPFGSPGGRLYRTGDRVRRWACGTVEFLGRADQQIKLRGYRIEPGEIEAALLAIDGVKETVVLLREDQGRRYLAAYLGTAAALSAEDLRRALVKRLPDYLIPSHFLLMPQLPRTQHGKIDRRALPLPTTQTMERVAPRNDIERRLAEIWQALLGCETVGITDNFFELGGDSILSIQAVSRGRRAGLAFSPKDVFQHPTLERLARVVKPLGQTIAPTAAVGELPLLPIQAEFFARPIPVRSHWNQSLLLQTRQPLDTAALQTALAHLLRHHDALRLRYRQEDGGNWSQRYAEADVPTDGLLWQRQATDAGTVTAIAQQAQRSLNLIDGPLLRAAHIRLADGSERLLLVIHHLVVDGVSWRILLEDLQTAYTQARRGRVLSLPVPTSSFQAWTRRLADYACGADLRQELAYWEEQLRGIKPTLPCDHSEGLARNADEAMSPRDKSAPPPLPVGEGWGEGVQTVTTSSSISLSFDRDTTRRLRQETAAAYRIRIQELLLTALARVLCRWTGQPEVLVELEGHGREDLFPELDLTRTVGWFTTAYPVRLSPAADPGPSIQAVKEQLRQVPNHGLGYGLLKHLAPADLRERLQSLPVPVVTFNYLGQFDASFDPDTLYAPATEDSGEERDAAAPLGNELVINGQVYEGRLRLDWQFNPARHSQESVQHWVDAYQAELEMLISHCLSGACGLTPSDFPLARLSQAGLDALALSPSQLEDLYPLAPMQQGILFHSLQAPEAGLYVTQLALNINGLDVERFKQAWRTVIARHAILRTGFIWQGGLAEPLQAVFRQVELPVNTVELIPLPNGGRLGGERSNDREATDLTRPHPGCPLASSPPLGEGALGLNSTAMELPVEVLDWRGQADNVATLAQLAETERARGFDLARPPLLRLLLVRLGDDRYRLVWTSHHLLLDGWSQSQLMGEVLRHYAGEPPTRQGLGDYRDYIAWLARQNQAKSEAFWRKRLQPLEEPTRLADALPTPSASSGHGACHCHLSRAETQALQAYALAQQITLNTLVQGAWTLLLWRYTGKDTVAFGATVAGRPIDLAGAEDLLGLFINTLPVVQTPPSGLAVGAWLRRLQADNLSLREHEHIPLYAIQRWAGQGLERELFDTLLVFENYPVDAALKSPGLGLDFGGLEQHDRTNYPLTVDVAVGEVLEIHFDYAESAFRDPDIQRLAGQMRQMLLALAENADRPVGCLGLAAEASAPPQSHIPAILLYEAIASNSLNRPDTPALLGSGQALSYSELESRSNRLARRLLKEGVTAESIVGLCLPRSPEFIVAALAVWKAGAAFLPLDPAYPSERLVYMLDDAGSALMLTEAKLAQNGVLPQSVRPYCLDLEDWAGEDAAPLSLSAHPQQLAYLIYTSGSTGRPKGVAVSHAALAAHCHAIGEAFALDAEDCALHFASFSFDASVEQWAVPLLRGARLLVSGPDLWTAEQTAESILAHAVTRLDLPPDYLLELARLDDAPTLWPFLRSITVGGEALPRESFQFAMTRLRPPKLFNAYGPTEAVITPLLWQAAADSICDTGFAPIGQAVGERVAHVLDADLNPLPTGVAGELYIGGVGLARGYFNRPGQTAERFLPDPFGPLGGRLYRTGDRARRMEDGTIEYLGRVDTQVKLRGFRIELGEVEAALLAQPDVREAAAAVVGSGGGRSLLAYAAGSELAPETLREALKQRLPAFMLPAQIIVLERLPRLPGGKLDRQALPTQQTPTGGLILPRNEAEAQLATIWQEILELPEIGVTEHFFELGGHSLLALRLVSVVNQRLGWNLSLSQVLQTPTIAELARPRNPSGLSPLLALNACRNGAAPLFCVHPAGGTVFAYLPLARALAGQRPVFGLLCRGFLDADWDTQTLQEIAQDYAGLLMAAQPDGPLHLLGWSLGGALAMAMARCLEQAGRTVDFLGLVDPYLADFDDRLGEEPPAEGNAVELSSKAPSPNGGELARGPLGWECGKSVASLPFDRPPPNLPPLGEGTNSTALQADGEVLPASIPPADAATGLRLMRRLSDLAKAHRLQTLAVAPHCWWSQEAAAFGGTVQDCLEQGLGQPARSHTSLSANHTDIIQAPELLDAIGQLLGGNCPL